MADKPLKAVELNYPTANPLQWLRYIQELENRVVTLELKLSALTASKVKK